MVFFDKWYLNWSKIVKIIQVLTKLYKIRSNLTFSIKVRYTLLIFCYKIGVKYVQNYMKSIISRFFFHCRRAMISTKYFSIWEISKIGQNRVKIIGVDTPIGIGSLWTHPMVKIGVFWRSEKWKMDKKWIIFVIKQCEDA